MAQNNPVEDAAPDTASEKSAPKDNAKSDTPYPYHPLREAERLVEAIAKTGGSESSEADACAAVGLKSKISRSWTYRLSSAREFGLITKMGRGEDVRVVISPLGRMLQMPESPDEVAAARMKAFLTPTLYQRLMQRYGGMVVPDVKGLTHILVREFNLLPSIAPNAAEAFLDSARHVGAIGVNGRFISPGANGAALPAATPADGAPPPPPPPAADELPAEMTTGNTKLMKHSYLIRGGTVEISVLVPRDLKQKDVRRIKNWLTTLAVDADDDDGGEEQSAGGGAKA